MRKKTTLKTTQPKFASRWEEQWHQQLAFLEKFHEKNGRWPMFTEEFPSGNRLGQWVNRQRDLYTGDEMGADRIALFKRIKFEWEKMDARGFHWETQYEHLKEFRKANPKRWPFARQNFPVGNRIGLWVWRQRQAFANGSLTKERTSLLKKIGFPLELPDVWEEQFALLKQFRVKFPDRWPKAREEFPKGRRLGLWCHLQRCAQKTNHLLPERSKKLEKIGFQWSVKQESWKRFYQLLLAYKKKNPSRWPSLHATALKDRRLIAWCSIQRQKRASQKLDKEKVALLTQIGFRW